MFGGLFGGGSNNNDNNSNDKDTPFTPDVPSSTPSPFASSPASALSSSGSDTKTRLQNAIVQQTNLVNAKYLIQKINDNCFEHCVAEPGASLSGREQSCLSTCMEKYIDGWNVVSKTYVARLQKEAPGMQSIGRPGV